jgi:SAM-dependent methyltransferase
MTEWFEEWFGEEYLHLYPHRDEADAERVVALLERLLPWQRGWRVLDVGCGAGRHLKALWRAGARAVGLDLSPSLLARARQVADAPLVRSDMRQLPIRPGSIDLTLNLFTSFGYFALDAEHDAALAGMVGTVRPGGWLAIDFLNASLLRTSLVPQERARLGEVEVQIERRITEDGRFVVKTIITQENRRFTERVRLFSADELAAMLEAHGLSVTHRLGDYDGNPYTAESPRVLLIGRRQ